MFDKAGLPASTYPAFKEAIEAMREGGFVGEPGGAARLKRRMIERVLTRCRNDAIDELEPLLTLLRRFATEAAREEARLFCDELIAEQGFVVEERFAVEEQYERETQYDFREQYVEELYEAEEPHDAEEPYEAGDLYQAEDFYEEERPIAA